MSFEDLLKELQGEKIAAVDPGHISLDELFNESFMREHSDFSSFGEFLEKGNFQAQTHEDIANIHDELFDRYVARETNFSCWKDMLDTANSAHAGRE